MSDLLTRKQAAARLGISIITLDEERAAGRLTFIQRAPGCRVFFRESDLDAWIERHTHTAIPVAVLQRNTYRRKRA